jgi:hypothetical protein
MSLNDSNFSSTTTTIAISNVPEDSEESEYFEPEDDFVTLVEDPISCTGDDFDDWSC